MYAGTSINIFWKVKKFNINIGKGEIMVHGLKKEKGISIFILSLGVPLKFVLHRVKENVNFVFKLKEQEL